MTLYDVLTVDGEPSYHAVDIFPTSIEVTATTLQLITHFWRRYWLGISAAVGTAILGLIMSYFKWRWTKGTGNSESDQGDDVRVIQGFNVEGDGGSVESKIKDTKNEP